MNIQGRQKQELSEHILNKDKAQIELENMKFTLSKINSNH